MASTGGSGSNPGGSGYGGSGSGASGSGGQKSQDPTVPRSFPGDQLRRTEWQYDQEPVRPSCIKGTCERDQHEHKDESDYTYMPKK